MSAPRGGRRLAWKALALLAFLPLRAGPADAQEGARAIAAQPSPAREAFERLKALEGDREGPSTDAATGAVYLENARFEYRLSGGGSVLLERANAGTPEEMLSVFYLDGDRLVLQHYCSAGNQPRLELVRADADELEFDFAGGHNVDPAVDGHIHHVLFTFHPEGRVESLWSWYAAGKEDHVNRRVIRR